MLAVDTSSKAGSCAFYHDSTLLGEVFLNKGDTHSQTALPMIDSLLAMVENTIDHVDYFAVCQGPGSFTGLRIGLSLIKGLGFTQNSRVIPLSTLRGLAYNFLGSQLPILTVLDARRHQVYMGLYQGGEQGMDALIEDQILTTQELKVLLSERDFGDRILVAGDGGPLVIEDIGGELPQLVLAPEHLRHQRASSLGRGALDRLKHHPETVIRVEELEPIYLRIAQAERERKEKEALL